jgi:hypothetical protein
MMPNKSCPLCELILEAKDLRESHFMPAALYNAGKHRLEYATRSWSGKTAKQIKHLLLCGACEKLFDERGESEVLLHVAPKMGHKFPLREKLRLALPRETSPDLQRFAGDDLGIDMGKFAYFALSVVWRAAVHDWEMFDGTTRPRMTLGDFEPPIRRFLAGRDGFPPNTAVIVIVCSDSDARKVWTFPTAHVEANCLNFRFLVRGVMFRVMMGYQMPPFFRDMCCTSARKCLFFGSAAHRMPEILQIFEPAPQGV